jgi:hypothetical protein
LLIQQVTYSQEANKPCYLISNLNSFRISIFTPANGSNLQQTSDPMDISRWQLIPLAGNRYRIQHISSGLYIGAPANGTKTAGRKLELTNSTGNRAQWVFEHQGNGVFRIKNIENNFFIANLGNNNLGASINQVLSPGGGALWKIQYIESSTNETLPPSNGPTVGVKNYPKQSLATSRTIGASHNISQNPTIDYAYNVSMIYGNNNSNNSNNVHDARKYIVLETFGSTGFNPGNVAFTGENNNPRNKRGYYIESIKTEAKIINGPSNVTLTFSGPATTQVNGTTGSSQGFSISVSGSAGADAAGPTGSATVSLGYDISKVSDIQVTDYSITETRENNGVTHEYKLGLLKRPNGMGNTIYEDFRSFKNNNNLVTFPMMQLFPKSYSYFPLYEYIAFDAPKDATGLVTIRLRASMTLNYVTWNGSKLTQFPEIVQTEKILTVNLSDVGQVTP